jgi:hypothetical protein
MPGRLDTSDTGFARAFERGDIPPQEFHHRDHLRLAWAYLAECGSTHEAIRRVAAGIRRFAAAAGAAEKYHETLTAFWVTRLALVRSRLAGGADLDDAIRADSGLLDKDLPLAYYSRDRLFGDDARRTWVEPDVRSLE